MSAHPPSRTSKNIVGVHFKVGKKIGEGSFGIIYQGKLHILLLQAFV